MTYNHSNDSVTPIVINMTPYKVESKVNHPCWSYEIPITIEFVHPLLIIYLPLVIAYFDTELLADYQITYFQYPPFCDP